MKAKAGKAAVAEGRYDAVIKTVADIGTQTVQKYQAKSEDDTEEISQLILELELVEISKKDNVQSLSKWLRNTKSSKGGLAKLCKAAGIGDIKTADLTNLLGKGVEVVVEHTENGNAKITEFIPIKKGKKIAKGFMEEKSVSLDEDYDPAAFEGMPKFIQDAILKSDEFTAVDAKAKGKRGKGK